MEDFCPGQAFLINDPLNHPEGCDNYSINVINREKASLSCEWKCSFEASYTAEYFPNEQKLTKSQLEI